MGEPLQNQPYVTMDEYQAFNVAAEWRHEYANGRMWPQGYPDHSPNSMAGASEAHNDVKSNTEFALRSQLPNGPCRVRSSDVQVWNEEAEFSAFPDLVAYREESKFEKHRGLDSLLNPRLIVEVLSRTTENFDRQQKFALYRQFASLEEYLLIDSRNFLVEHYRRSEDGSWRFTAHNSPEDEVLLTSIGCRLALSDIYAGVEFPPPDPRWPRLVR